MEKGPEFVSPFELKMQPNTCGLEAGYIRKAGFWEMLLTDVMAPSEESDLQECGRVTRSNSMGCP